MLLRSEILAIMVVIGDDVCVVWVLLRVESVILCHNAVLLIITVFVWASSQKAETKKSKIFQLPATSKQNQ